MTNFGGKVTYRVAPGNTLVAYAQRGRNHQPNRLDPLSRQRSVGDDRDQREPLIRQRTSATRAGSGRANGTRLFDDSLSSKCGWDSTATSRTDARSAAPRFEDIETLVVSGGNRDWQQRGRRNQVFGSLSHFRDGWLGGHHFKLGGEAIRFLVRETLFSGFPGNVLHVIQSGVPSSVFSSTRRSDRRPGCGATRRMRRTRGGCGTA